MNPKIILLLLILFGSLQGFTQIGAQRAEDLQFTDSLVTPRIDGMKDYAFSTDVIGEWDDAIVDSMVFSSTRDSQTAKIYQKSVGSLFFVALEVPETTQSTILQFDIDGSATASVYDIRFHIEKGLRNDTLLLKLEIHDGQTWQTSSRMETSNNLKQLSLGLEEQLGLLFNIGVTSESVEPKHKHWINLDSVMIEIEFNRGLFYSILEDFTGVSGFDNGIMSLGVVSVDNDGSIVGFPSLPNQIDGEFVFEQFDQNGMGQYAPEEYTTDIGIENVIITQAIQSDDNSLSLVKDKTTMVRVFVDHNEDNNIPVEVTLSGYLTGGDLIYELGSHTTLFHAPTSTSVNVLSSSVNFILPASWVDNSDVQLRIQVNRQGYIDTNYDDNIMVKNTHFEDTYDMTIYYLKINTGTENFPELPSDFKVNQILTAFRESFPIANPTFVELDWNEVGPFSGTDQELLVELDQVYFGIIQSIADEIDQFGSSNIPFPDQIAGIRVGTSGLSSPNWSDNPGNGVSVVLGEENPLVLSHEVNHNIGPDDWGRHVSGEGFGCDAPGPDQEWDDLYNDDNIHEVGWSPTWGLFSPNVADFMSYCFGPYPGTWVSDYRWELLHSILSNDQSPFLQPNVVNELNLVNLGASHSSSSRFIGGTISNSGSISMKPSYGIPGNVMSVLPQLSDYTHEILVEYVDGTNTSIHLNLSTSGDEISLGHQNHENMSFGYWLPDDGNIIQYSVINSVNDTILFTSNTMDLRMDIELISTTTIERNGETEIYWEGSTSNTTTVYSQFQFSPDNITWHNVGSFTTNNSTMFNPGKYPGTDNGIFRVIMTNGFDTTLVYSAQNIQIEGLDPITKIRHQIDTAIHGNFAALMGSSISLTGEVYDIEDHKIAESRYQWNVYYENGTLHSTYSGIRIVDFAIYEVGLFTIELVATDLDGMTNSTSMLLEILAPIQVSEATSAEFKVWLEGFHDETETKSDTEKSINPNNGGTMTIPVNFTWVVIGILLTPTIFRKIGSKNSIKN